MAQNFYRIPPLICKELDKYSTTLQDLLEAYPNTLIGTCRASTDFKKEYYDIQYYQDTVNVVGYKTSIR